MKTLGLFLGSDLKKLSEADLRKHFGKSGAFFYKIVRGIDDREVQPYREIKSIGAEDTFPFDLTSLDDMKDELLKITKTVYNRLLKNGFKGRTVTLKIKYHDFKRVTRSHSFPEGVDDRDIIFKAACDLLTATDPESKKIRLLGVSLSNLDGGLIQDPPGEQLPLFL